VLRVLEGRSDAEIADVLRCSEAAARRHVRRGLTAGDHPMAPTAQSASPRQVVARSGTAQTGLLSRPALRETDVPARRRHRGPWLAALAVLTLVAGVAYVAHESRTPAGVIRYPAVQAPSSWRYESYAGVQLRVPDTWGWGASPIRSPDFDVRGHLGACGTDQAAVQSPADHSPYVSFLTGFVGRPAIVTERCVNWGADGVMPRGDAVWFDSPLPVGVKEVASTVAETRAVGGQRVTVFSDRSSLRRQILGTAEQVDVDGNGCPTHAVVRPMAGPSGLKPDTLSVCVYSQDTGVTRLMYSAALPAAVAHQYVARVAAVAPEARGCPTPHGRWVALGLTGDDGSRWDVANLGCGRIELSGRSVGLTPGTAQTWAAGGVTAYVAPPRDAGSALDALFGAPSP
jgi:hypothetical protein